MKNEQGRSALSSMIAGIIASNRGDGAAFGQKAMVFTLDRSRNLTRPVGVEVLCSKEEMDEIFATVRHMTCVGGGVCIGQEMVVGEQQFTFQCISNDVRVTIFLMRVEDLMRAPWRKCVTMIRASKHAINKVSLDAPDSSLRRALPPPPAPQVFEQSLSEEVEQFARAVDEARQLTGSVPCGYTSLEDFYGAKA